MSLICGLTNVIPQVPVVHKKNGAVYDKSALEKHLEENNSDPYSGEYAKISDYIEVKTPSNMKPKPPSANSIPALLKAQQDEWDALMIYNFAQRNQMQILKQELSHSLYQYDANCRVISRLTKEVTAAREALSTLKPQTGIISNQQLSVEGLTENDLAMNQNVQDPTGMDSEIVSRIDSCAKQLTAERKKKMKQLPENLAKSNDIQKYTLIDTKSGFHSAGLPGILALDVCRKNSSRIITGGNDKNAVVYDTDSGQIISTLKGHSKKVTSVIYHPIEETAITASVDHTVRIWSINNGSCEHIIRAHLSEVTGISLHATNKYVLSCGNDGFWAFSDLEVGNVVVRTESKNKRTDMLNKFTCMKCHPDGLICANGTEDGEVIIWNLTENREVAFLSHSTAASVTSLAFSENGYYLVTGGNDGIIKLWDLRKVEEFKSFTPAEDRNVYQIKDLEFDITGTYLGVAGSDARVFQCKQWTKVVNFSDHTGLVTGIRFGHNSNTIISAGLDRCVRIYGQD